MSTATFDESVAMRPRATSRGWLLLGCVALVVLLAAATTLGRTNAAVLNGTYGLRLLIEAAALLWARRRPELPASLRRALLVLGSTSVASAVDSALRLAGDLAGAPLLPVALGNAYIVLSYGLAVVGVSLMPMAAFRRGEWSTFALDLTISVGGYLVVLSVLQLIPVLNQHLGSTLVDLSLVNGVASALILVVLNLLTIRGRAVPSRRAFWLLMGGLSAYLPATLLMAIAPASPPFVLGADIAYFLGVIPTLFAAEAIRHDVIAETPQQSHPDWFRSFNPFSLAMPLVVGLALWRVIRHGPEWAEPPLAITAAALSMLLAIRLVLTIRENDRRVREQVRDELRAQADRFEALRRVAGGVAHAFNNSLTVVIGQAELGVTSAAHPESAGAFAQIRAAGERSATLTRHLLWFTGRQHQDRAWLHPAEWMRTLGPELCAVAGPTVALEMTIPPASARLRVDADQLRDVLVELTRNASRAMPAGGRLQLALGERRIGAADSPGEHDPLPAGRYACIAVRDSGAGMSPEVLARVFEPFYSSRPDDPAAGLGLSVAHGVVRAHGGRIEVDSRPGEGSEFRVLLPIADD